MAPTQNGPPVRPRSENSSPRHSYNNNNRTKTNGSSRNSNSSATGTIPKMRPQSMIVGNFSTDFDEDNLDTDELNSTVIPPPIQPSDLLNRLRDQQDQIRHLQSQGQAQGGANWQANVPGPDEIVERLSQLQQRFSVFQPIDVNNGYDEEDNDDYSLKQTTDMEIMMAEKLDLVTKMKHLEAKKKQIEAMMRDQESKTKQFSQALPKSGEELADLKTRLRELQGMVNVMEGHEEVMEDTVAARSVSKSPRRAKKKSGQMASTDHLLAEMQEQLKLQKELHLRRKELEDLMKKDFMENLRKSEEESRNNFSDTKSDVSSSLRSNPTAGWCFLPDVDRQSSEGGEFLVNAAMRGHPERSRQMSFSSNRSQPQIQHGDGRSNVTNKQLELLQNQIENLHMDIRRINTPSQSNQQEHQYFQFLVQQQQQQIQHLATSVNQCFQAVVSVQRDVAALQRAVEKLTTRPVTATQMVGTISRPITSVQEGTQQPQTANNNNNNNNNNANEFGNMLDNSPNHFGQQQRREFLPWQDSDFGSRLIASFENSSPMWISSQANSTSHQQPPMQTQHSGNDYNWVSNIGLHSQHQNVNSHLRLNETSANNGVQGALNNQVPPGIRANNYWDNFRSFSRQNRLSSSSTHATPPLSSLTPPATFAAPSVVTTTTTAAAPNVAQVTPRQLQLSVGMSGVQQPLPSLFPVQSMQNSNHPQSASASARQAYIEPNFSSLNGAPRPRRKQKINREQNRETSTCFDSTHSNVIPNHTAAAMVFPMPQDNSRNVNRTEPSTTVSQQPPINLATVNPIAHSLTRSIFNQINNLVSQHEEQPDQLAMIFHDLQSLDARLVPMDGDQRLNSQRTQDMETNTMFPFGQSHPESGASTQPFQMNNCSPKVKKEKRFSGLTRSPKSSKTTSNVSRLLSGRNTSENDDRSSLFSIHNSLGEMSSLLQGAVGGVQSDNKEEQTNSGGIPKNIQRNLMSSKPKNMQQSPSEAASSDELTCMPETDMAISQNQQQDHSSEDDFINVQLRFAGSIPQPEEINNFSNPLILRNEGSEAEANNPLPIILPPFMRNEENKAAAAANGEEEERSEMAEADQDFSPDQSFQASGTKAEETESNLTRLTSDNLEQQRRDEDEQNVRSFVEEVLRSCDEDEEEVERVLPPQAGGINNSQNNEK